MSEISLKEYVSKLESALNEKAADEVIQHCRHILRSFPKNVTAYRLMGGALLELGRYEEAGAALQRVLSVLPDDYAAHLGLSDAYTGQNRADDAIWHLERAFEQNPNNTKLIDRLRGLYRRFRKGENVKIQMTSAAVARLQMRNRQYEAAIHTLRGTLQRYPDRVDLKLLLTRALWETGEVLDAAEMAVAVLTVLPNCLEANRLMTELWLSEDRPSDAQPYLYRVEAVDPYLAYELVQGEAPPDDAFRLEELDYRRAAHEVLVNSRPDWLLGITDEIAGGRDESEQRSNWESPLLAGSLVRTQEQASPLFDDLEVADTLFDQDAEPAFDSLFDPPAARNQETSDWMSEYLVDTPDADRVALEDSFTTTPVKQLGTQSNKLPMSWALNEDEDDPKLGVLGGTGADAEAIPDWVQAATEHPDFADAYQQDSDEEESMDWLRDEIFQDEASIQLSSRQTEPLQTPKTGDDELTIDSDALDWYEDPKSRASAASSGSSLGLTDMLRGGDFEWMQDDNAATSPPASSVSDAEPDEWLSLFEPDAQPAPSPASDWISELEMNDEQKPTSNDLPDWMSPSSGETWLPEQDMPDEPLASDVPDWMREFAPQDDTNSSPVVQTGELGWMSDDVPAPADELGWLNTATEDDPFAAPSPAVPTATLDWLNEDAPAAPQRTDSLSWLDDELPTDQPSSSDDETPDWMIDLQSPTGDATPSEGASIVTGDLGWLNTEDEEPEAAAVPQTDGLSWLNSVEEDDELPADQPSSTDDETPDWMKELDSEEEAAEAEIPDWMSELQPSGGVVTESTRIETGDLGWLNTEDEEQEAAAVPQTDGLSWLNSVEEDDELPTDQPSSSDDETPDWMKELDSEEEAVEAEIPGWMSELQPSSGVVTPSEETPVESDDFGWLNTEDEVQEAAAIPQTDGLSWLNSVEEDDEQPADQPSSTDDDETPDWMKELDSEEEAVEADIPEWMSALEPEANAEPAASTEAEPGGFEWMTDAEEAEPAAESGEFGWLDAVEEPAQPESSGESGDFEWFTEEEEKQRDAQELAAMTSTPDWLAALQNDDEEETAAPVSVPSEEAAAVSETPDWLSELNSEDEDAEEAVSDEPDWLSEVRAEDEPASASEAAPASTDEFDWLSGESSESEEAAVVSETPDWLSELNSEDEAAEEAAVSDEPDWLSEVRAEDEPASTIEAAPVSTPADEFDWLSGESNEAEEAAVVSETPDWLSEVRAEDEAAEEAAAVSDEPDWLSEVRAEDEPVSTIEAAPASTDEFDWLSEDSESEEEAAAVSEVPDWLSEVHTEDEEAPASAAEEFEWGAEAEELEAAADEVMGVPAAADEEFALTPDEDEGLPDWVSAAAPMSDINNAPDEQGFGIDEEEAAFAPTPAENAPDWLNAMVPGIDVDVTAIEAEADEPEPVSASSGSTRDYDWVVEMVEAEQNAEAAADAPPSGARFTFTRPPAWMSASKPDDRLPDWPSDDDMPEWLR